MAVFKIVPLSKSLQLCFLMVISCLQNFKLHRYKFSKIMPLFYTPFKCLVGFAFKMYLVDDKCYPCLSLPHDKKYFT
jgi:hypothetical protein